MGPGMKPRRAGKAASALDWLLEEDQPSVRYLALTQLLGRGEDDPQVVAARAMIPKKGWAKDILAKQHRDGWWVSGESLYVPKYLSTNWMLLVLSDLGLTRGNPRIAKACDLWIARYAKADGGFGADRMNTSHVCTAGNTARALVRFGYADHPKVVSAFEWFVKHRDKNGGWSCFGSGRNLDSWEPLSAFAALPRQAWTAGMTRAVEDAAEFYLARELHKQGDRYGPWYRFHYPIHYYYDLLVGLDVLTALGYTDDPGLRYAVAFLQKKRRSDGRWNLDAVHPDLEGSVANWYKKRPPTPFAVEEPGQPSKMVTLRAMAVLNRAEGAT